MLRIGGWALFGAVVFALGVAETRAAPVFFDDRADFDAATGGLSGFESFEGIVPNGSPLVFAGFTVSETKDNFNGLFQEVSEPTDGTKTLGYIPGTTSSELTFVFDAPVHAVGFDITKNNGGAMNVSGGATTSFPLLVGGAVFFGVVDLEAPFTTLTLSPTLANGNTQIDAVAFGTVSSVPEPAMVWMLAVAAASCLVASRWRRPGRVLVGATSR